MLFLLNLTDSGGPLFMYDDVSNPFRPYWLLVGVVSYGPKDCGTPGYPGRLLNKMSVSLERITFCFRCIYQNF